MTVLEKLKQKQEKEKEIRGSVEIKKNCFVVRIYNWALKLDF